MAKPVRWVVVACVHAFAVVAVGYVLLGLIPMLLFASGFVGGLGIWLGTRDRADFADIMVPYFLTLAAIRAAQGGGTGTGLLPRAIGPRRRSHADRP